MLYCFNVIYISVVQQTSASLIWIDGVAYELHLVRPPWRPHNLQMPTEPTYDPILTFAKGHHCQCCVIILLSCWLSRYQQLKMAPSIWNTSRETCGCRLYQVTSIWWLIVLGICVFLEGKTGCTWKLILKSSSTKGQQLYHFFSTSSFFCGLTIIFTAGHR